MALVGRILINLKKNILFISKLNLILFKCKEVISPIKNHSCFAEAPTTIFTKNQLHILKKKIKTSFFSKTFNSVKVFKNEVFKANNTFTFLNKFLINFLEVFLKKKIIFNIKKGSNNLIIRQIGLRKFYFKYFKRNLKVSKRLIGILYYSLLLKDASIFTNFFGSLLEKLNVKLHKKIFLGLKKLIKDVFKPIFAFIGVVGLFFNIKGKIGVSGSAKKRRYFFSYGRHSLTSRAIKIDSKLTSVWTFTGVLGFSFLIFF